MTFRALDKRDIDLIVDIQKDNFPDGWNKAQLLSGMDGGNLCAVGLEVEGEIVGLITYTLVIDVADIEGVVVKKSERKRGYGKLLVEFALSELKKQKAISVILEVRESNAPAIALYGACGFNKISVRKKYYSDGENAVIMQKEI